MRQAMTRTRAAQKWSGAGSGVAVLPGKLTDCASDDPERNELFIVGRFGRRFGKQSATRSSRQCCR
jgi:DNA gyrase/topoisomerase IV subunit B